MSMYPTTAVEKSEILDISSDDEPKFKIKNRMQQLTTAANASPFDSFTNSGLTTKEYQMKKYKQYVEKHRLDNETNIEEI